MGPCIRCSACLFVAFVTAGAHNPRRSVQLAYLSGVKYHPTELLIQIWIASVCGLNCHGVYGCTWRHISSAQYLTFVSREPHDGWCGWNSWQASLPRTSSRKGKVPLRTFFQRKQHHRWLQAWDTSSLSRAINGRATDPGGGCSTRRQQLRDLVSLRP